MFRLPTEDEYNKLAEMAQVKLHSDSCADYSCPIFYLNCKGDNNLSHGGTSIVVNRNDKEWKVIFQQNINGALHIGGNLSEYLDDGRSIGGSWYTYPSEIAIIDNNHKGNSRTGFRSWMEKKE